MALSRMSRLCALGAVVLVQASTPPEFDYDKLMKEYSGGAYDKYTGHEQHTRHSTKGDVSGHSASHGHSGDDEGSFSEYEDNVKPQAKSPADDSHSRAGSDEAAAKEKSSQNRPAHGRQEEKHATGHKSVSHREEKRAPAEHHVEEKRAPAEHHSEHRAGHADEGGGGASGDDQAVGAKGSDKKSAPEDKREVGISEANATDSKKGWDYMHWFIGGSGHDTFLVADHLVEQASTAAANATRDLATESKEAAAAEDAIAKIQKWNEGMKANLRNRNFSRMVSTGIVSKVQADFYSRRQDLKRAFDRALRGVDPTVLEGANSSVVEEKVDAAKAVIRQIRHLDHAEARKMRETLHEIGKAGKLKAKELAREASTHAKQVHIAGKAAARAQRMAGMHEGVYERQEDNAQDHSERLSGHIEEAAERAEGLIERQSGQVENHLERMMDELDDEQSRAVECDKDRLRAALDLVEKARKRAAPTVFLVRSDASQDFVGAALAAPFACAAALVAAFALAAARGRSARPTSVQHPLLG